MPIVDGNGQLEQWIRHHFLLNHRYHHQHKQAIQLSHRQCHQPMQHLPLLLFMFHQRLVCIKVFRLGKQTVQCTSSDYFKVIHLDHQWLRYVIQCVAKSFHVHFMVGLPIVVI